MPPRAQRRLPDRPARRATAVAWLAATAAFLAPARSGAVAPGMVAVHGLERVERILLPDLGGAATARAQSIDAVVVVDAPRAAASLARALRSAHSEICPQLEPTPSGAVLRCGTRRVMAQLVRTRRGHALELSVPRGLPWRGDDAVPLLPLLPTKGDGDARACASLPPLDRAECLLARGEPGDARALLAEITGDDARGLAAVRLGDLALAAGDTIGATAQWRGVSKDPWLRLATARLCELSWPCLSSTRHDDLYARTGMPPLLADDLLLRHARALAFLGRSPDAVRVLLSGAPTACNAAPSLCRDVVASALRDPRASSQDGRDALALWLFVPDRDGSAVAYETAVAAADVAEREGAPAFAANLLAAAAGHVPLRGLDEHLLRTSELYLQAGDKVRAGVVIEFARTRAGARGLKGAPWAAVLRRMGMRPAAARATAAAPAAADISASHAAGDDRETRAALAEAARVAQAARTLPQGGSR